MMRRRPAGRKGGAGPARDASQDAEHMRMVRICRRGRAMRGRIALALASLGGIVAGCSLWFDGGLDPFSIPAVILGLGVWVHDQPR